MNHEKKIKLVVTIPENQLNQRLDFALAKLFPNYSRSCIKKWILSQCVLVNGKVWNKPEKKVLGREKIIINADLKESNNFEPQDIPLDILYEDSDIMIVNKQHGLVVHPGAGNPNGTLLNALLHYYPNIINVPRVGIIHRLDKNSSGLMVVAKNIFSQIHLTKALRLRKIIREYEAVVTGQLLTGGTVKQPINRHKIKRICMSVDPIMGKYAITHYHIINRFRTHTHIRLRIETGRTHQIRVHMAYINHPLVGDKTYGGYPNKLPKGASKEFIAILQNFKRQALHATTLCFNHPTSGSEMKWHSSIPQDMMKLIEAMRVDFSKSKKCKTF